MIIPMNVCGFRNINYNVFYHTTEVQYVDFGILIIIFQVAAQYYFAIKYSIDTFELKLFQMVKIWYQLKCTSMR